MPYKLPLKFPLVRVKRSSSFWVVECVKKLIATRVLPWSESGRNTRLGKHSTTQYDPDNTCATRTISATQTIFATRAKVEIL
mgnify:CR=1 FL=1